MDMHMKTNTEKLNEKINAYEILGLTPTASFYDIQMGFKRKALIYHPDRGGELEHFLVLQRAFEILETDSTREFLGRQRLFDPLPIRLQPSLSQTTAILFQNIQALGTQLDRATRA